MAELATEPRDSRRKPVTHVGSGNPRAARATRIALDARHAAPHPAPLTISLRVRPFS